MTANSIHVHIMTSIDLMLVCDGFRPTANSLCNGSVSLKPACDGLSAECQKREQMMMYVRAVMFMGTCIMCCLGHAGHSRYVCIGVRQTVCVCICMHFGVCFCVVGWIERHYTRYPILPFVNDLSSSWNSRIIQTIFVSLILLFSKFRAVVQRFEQ